MFLSVLNFNKGAESFGQHDITPTTFLYCSWTHDTPKSSQRDSAGCCRSGSARTSEASAVDANTGGVSTESLAIVKLVDVILVKVVFVLVPSVTYRKVKVY